MSNGDHMQTEETMSLNETFCLPIKQCQTLKLTAKPRKPCLSQETFTYGGNSVSHGTPLPTTKILSLIGTPPLPRKHALSLKLWQLWTTCL